MCTYYNICILIQQLLKAFSLLCVLSSKFFTQMDDWESQTKWSLSLFYSLSLRERFRQADRSLTPDVRAMPLASGGYQSTVLASFWLRQVGGSHNTILSGNDSGKRWLLQHRLAGDFSESSSSPVISLV